MLHKWHLMHFIISTFNSKDQGKLQESFEPWVASVNERERISSHSDSLNNPAGVYPESFPEKKAFHGLDYVMSIRLTLMGSTIINFQPFGNGWLFDSKVWSKRGTIIMWRQLLFLYCSRELIQRQSSVTGKIHGGTDSFPELKLSVHFHCCLQKEKCNAVRCCWVGSF